MIPAPSNTHCFQNTVKNLRVETDRAPVEPRDDVAYYRYYIDGVIRYETAANAAYLYGFKYFPAGFYDVWTTAVDPMGVESLPSNVVTLHKLNGTASSPVEGLG